MSSSHLNSRLVIFYGEERKDAAEALAARIGHSFPAGTLCWPAGRYRDAHAREMRTQTFGSVAILLEDDGLERALGIMGTGLPVLHISALGRGREKVTGLYDHLQIPHVENLSPDEETWLLMALHDMINLFESNHERRRLAPNAVRVPIY